MEGSKEMAILIKTFLRDEVLYGCIESIEKYCKGITYKIYIADDGSINERKRIFYDNLTIKGHFVVILPFNTGASKCRNVLLSHLENEKYILRLDDDFYLSESTNIHAMKCILEENKRVGAVADLEIQMGMGKGSFSGQISTWQGWMDIKKNRLIIDLIPLNKFIYCSLGDIQYAKCGFSRNMLLLRREIFNDVQWDERFKFGGEHIDFLLQIKYSQWDLVMTPSSIHLHREDIQYGKETEDYRKIKKENNHKGNGIDVLSEKWGFNKIKIKRAFFSDYFKLGLIKMAQYIK